MYTTQTNRSMTACRYPGCTGKSTFSIFLDRLVDGLLCAASTMGIITALFFLLTL